jgi:hypothetical protein
MGMEPRWNVKRGLNRAFALFTVCWYIIAGLVLCPRWLIAIRAQDAAEQSIDYDALAKKFGAIDDWQDVPSWQIADVPGWSGPVPGIPPIKLPADLSPDPVKPLPSVDNFMAQQRARELRPIGLTVAFSLLPPVIYGFAYALLWVVRGFRLSA